MISRSFYNVSSTVTQDSVTWNVIYNPNKGSDVALIKKIYDVIYAAVKKTRCAECFEAAGAIPIIKQTGLVIVTESVFLNASLDYFWSPDNILADKLREMFYGAKYTFVKVYTANDVTTDEPYNGKRYIGITNRGIFEKDDYFSVTLIHALLHSGGIKGRGQKGSGLHDLIFLGKRYDDVLEACQDNNSRVGKAAGKGENGQ